jgi:hypothetical protein
MLDLGVRSELTKTWEDIVEFGRHSPLTVHLPNNVFQSDCGSSKYISKFYFVYIHCA